MVTPEFFVAALIANLEAIEGISGRSRDETDGRPRLRAHDSGVEGCEGRGSSESDRARGYKDDVVVGIKRHGRELYSVNMNRAMGCAGRSVGRYSPETKEGKTQRVGQRASTVSITSPTQALNSV